MKPGNSASKNKFFMVYGESIIVSELFLFTNYLELKKCPSTTDLLIGFIEDDHILSPGLNGLILSRSASFYYNNDYKNIRLE